MKIKYWYIFQKVDEAVFLSNFGVKDLKSINTYFNLKKFSCLWTTVLCRARNIQTCMYPFQFSSMCFKSFASLCSSSSHCYSKTKFEARVCICASAYNTRQQSQGLLINYVVTRGAKEYSFHFC